MPTNKRLFILAACCLLVLLCAGFPPRTFSPEIYIKPGRQFLFSSDIYRERVGLIERQSDGSNYAVARIDGARFAAELLVIFSLTGIALLATTPRA